MHYTCSELAAGVVWRGDTQADSVALLTHHGYPQTAGHCARVAAEAQRIAVRYGADARAAAIAGWLHDISAIIPNSERIAWAAALGLTILDEERTLPMIIHQKLSAAFAHELFAISDESILSAIGCHTTLRGGATLLDKIVFVADKIAWDQPGDPPYLDAITAALDRSLDAAAWCYLSYLWQRRDTLRVVHPWFVDAYYDLSALSNL